MSSLSGLNAAPRTAIRRPTKEPPLASRARSTILERRRMLMASTSRRKVSAWSAPSSPARAMKARMSLGRQPPPNPRPALRNLRPMRSSWPIASARVVDVRAGGLATSAMALMKEILVARNEFAAALTSSAVARSVTMTGAAGGDGPRVDLRAAGPRHGRRRPRRRAGRGAGCRRRRGPRAGTPGSTRPRGPGRSRPAARRGGRRCRPARWTSRRSAPGRAGARPAISTAAMT